MAYRKDVLKLAEKLSARSGIGTDFVYMWLMEVGRVKGKNPCQLQIDATEGRVYMVGDPDRYSLEKYTPPVPWEPSYDGPDYEALILERQDRYWD